MLSPGPNALVYNPRPIIRDFNITLLRATNKYCGITNRVNNQKSIFIS